MGQTGEAVPRFDADAGLVNLCRLYLIFQPVILDVLGLEFLFRCHPIGKRQRNCLPR